MNYSGSEKEIDEAISEVVAELQWDKEKLTPPEFLADFRIAQPISISHGPELDPSPADTLHPFLAFSRRRRTKVYAENLAWIDILKKYKQKGPLLEIPKDYPGWFEIMPNHTCKNRIGEIAEMKCKQFLVRTAVIGHLCLGNDDNQGEDPQLGAEIQIHPGDILSKGEIVVKKWKSSSVGSPSGGGGDGGSRKSKELVTKFLSCIDCQNKRILLPLGHPGEFYAIWNPDVGNASTDSDYVYYIYDLIQFGFPLMVRLVFGWPPADYPQFTGYLRLVDVRKPDTLVARSLKHGSCVIVELPIDGDFRICRIRNPESLVKSQSFEKILAHASDQVYPYLIGMKQYTTTYPLAKGAADDLDSGSTNEKRRTGHMAKPRDMKHFNILNVFPPLQETVSQMADSWTLCFKDPMFSIQDPAAYSVSDPRDTLTSEIRGIKINDPEEIHRRQLDHVLTEREAEC